MVDMQAEPFTVAVIEDQPIMRVSLSNVLAAENLNVVAMLAVSDSITKTLQSLKPDLILFSVGNQETRDWKCLQTLREALPSALIAVLLTGEVSGQDQTALKHGADLTIIKTAPRFTLLAAIQSLVERKFQPANHQVAL
jgi:DNA-binding NarL/FixJ family response regulator